MLQAEVDRVGIRREGFLELDEFLLQLSLEGSPGGHQQLELVRGPPFEGEAEDRDLAGQDRPGHQQPA